MTPTATAQAEKYIIILAGPCGSGKTTIAKHLSADFSAPFIEGDDLHSTEAKDRMANGIPLDDAIRAPWLSQIKRHALDRITRPGCDNVFVSCSALKKMYRDQLRGAESDDAAVRVVFVDLRVEKDELVRRMRERGAHFMKEGMVESQLAIREVARVEESDVLAVDAGKSVEEVVEEVMVALRNLGIV